MYKGKHAARSSPVHKVYSGRTHQSGKIRKVGTIRGFRSSLLVILAIAIVFSAGVTIAYLTDNTEPLTNTFTPSKVPPDITEVVESGIKKSVTIRNTGDTDAYIRVAVIANTVNDEGKITGPANVDDYLGAEGWTKEGSYYYWNKPVAPYSVSPVTTGELLKGAIDLAGIQVTILAESIQAKPYNADGISIPASEKWAYEFLRPEAAE